MLGSCGQQRNFHAKGSVVLGYRNSETSDHGLRGLAALRKCFAQQQLRTPTDNVNCMIKSIRHVCPAFLAHAHGNRWAERCRAIPACIAATLAFACSSNGETGTGTGNLGGTSQVSIGGAFTSGGAASNGGANSGIGGALTGGGTLGFTSATVTFTPDLVQGVVTIIGSSTNFGVFAV